MDKTCSIDDCGNPAHTKGWCRKHYQRWYKFGDPLMVTRIYKDDKKRLISKCRVDETTGCWNWIGSLNIGGYGVIDFKTRPYKAHRLSYELHVGPIMPGLIICHTCDNPPCVNPDHLYAGTYQDNSDDRFSDEPKPRVNPRLVTT